MKWVTRERPKIDRIACPWLIARFIDPQAEFLYVPSADVMTVAKEQGATPYDVPGVEYGHVGDRCSFDAFLKKHNLTDPALHKLAAIVRGGRSRRPAFRGTRTSLCIAEYRQARSDPAVARPARHLAWPVS